MFSIHASLQNPLEEAARYLSGTFETFGHNPILLMLSGGSAFEMLPYVNTEFVNKNFTLTVLDDRIVPTNEGSNFLELAESQFFMKCLEQGASYIDTRSRAGETPHELAVRIEKKLRAWKETNAEGYVIITQGIGADGHTAGIFPHSKEPFNEERWLVSYTLPEGQHQYNERLTVTSQFLIECVDVSVALAIGEEKKSIVERLKKEEVSAREFPAMLLKKQKHVELFTDQDI